MQEKVMINTQSLNQNNLLISRFNEDAGIVATTIVHTGLSTKSVISSSVFGSGSQASNSDTAIGVWTTIEIITNLLKVLISFYWPGILLRTILQHLNKR